MFRSSWSTGYTLPDFCRPIVRLRLTCHGTGCSNQPSPASILRASISWPVTMIVWNSVQYLEQFCRIPEKQSLASIQPCSVSRSRISHEDVCLFDALCSGEPPSPQSGCPFFLCSSFFSERVAPCLDLLIFVSRWESYRPHSGQTP